MYNIGMKMLEWAFNFVTQNLLYSEASLVLTSFIHSLIWTLDWELIRIIYTKSDSL